MTRTSKTRDVVDVDGRVIAKGDTVATINDNLTARVSDVKFEYDTGFVRIKPIQHPYSKGEWHAADRVQLINKSKAKK